MKIGKVLTELRNKRHLTQEQIADTLGVKRARYNAWENDISNPDFEMLKAIAQMHNVSIDYLLGHTLSRSLEEEMRRIISEDAVEGYSSPVKEHEDIFRDLVGVINYFTDGSYDRPTFPTYVQSDINNAVMKIKRAYSVEIEPNPDGIIQTCRSQANEKFTRYTFQTVLSALQPHFETRSKEIRGPLVPTYLNAASNIENESEPEIRAIQRAAKNMSPSDKKKMLNMIKAAFEEAFEGGDDDKT